MDAYAYQAALWCGPCAIKRLVEERKASPGALGMEPAKALQQIVSSNGFTDESDYDSDDLPKGPYSDGGGEADSPQHCDGCGLLLENPLTPDGYRYVNEKLTEHARDGSGDAEVLKQWSSATTQAYSIPAASPSKTFSLSIRWRMTSGAPAWGGGLGSPANCTPAARPFRRSGNTSPDCTRSTPMTTTPRLSPAPRPRS